MTADELIALVRTLPGTRADTIGEGSGAPPVAWGDTFFFHDPDDREEDRRIPFATIVTKDYPGFDTASDLDRDGVFRVNVEVGRERFEQLLGYAPAQLAEHHPDYRFSDVPLPHPTYGRQAWVSVVSPIEQSAAVVRDLLVEAHRRATTRHRRR